MNADNPRADLPPNVMQDGETFYVFAADGETVLEQHFAPFHVRDFDVTAARKARQWFLDQVKVREASL